ncbi:TetR family transcriptional regulator [Rhodobacterales bacterium HKCCE2091]|nr:TetR family transcriptional regulator [Rhodobacterales bacterium HKCCE2091]
MNAPVTVSTVNISHVLPRPGVPAGLVRGGEDAPAPAVKRKYHHGDLRTALVVAGLEILETEGLTGLSLRAVAARVGVSHTAPKNHFAGFRGLCTAIATEGFWRQSKAMRDDVGHAATGRDRLRAAISGYVRFALRSPALFELMFSTTLCDPEDPALAEAAGASRRILSGVADGLDRREGTESGCMMLWSLAHGYATLALARQFETGADGSPVVDVLSILPDFDYRDG